MTCYTWHPNPNQVTDFYNLKAMKRNYFFWVLAIFFASASTNLFAINYSTISNGSWTSAAVWAGGAVPPTTLPSGDKITIQHAVTLTANLRISGELKILASGTISGDKDIDVKSSGLVLIDGNVNITKAIKNEGTFTNNGVVNAEKLDNKETGIASNSGTMVLTEELKNHGTLTNSGSVTADKLTTDELDPAGSIYNSGTMFFAEGVHNHGYICNSGVIEVGPGEEFDNHKGTVDCGGIIYADEYKQNNNDASTTNQTICGTDRISDPEIQINNGVFDYPNTVVFCSTVLPVELLGFYSETNETAVKLHFQTGSERDLIYFIVESSTDGNEWTELAKIEAAGNSQEITSYSVTDESPSNGLSYYRLKNADINGKITILEVITSNFTSAKLALYPIPASKMLYLEGEHLAESSFTFTSNTGSKIDLPHFVLENKICFNVEELNAGIYFITIENSLFKKTERILVTD